MHLARNTFRNVAEQCWDRNVPGRPPGLHSTPEDAARERFVDFSDKWPSSSYPLITRLRENISSEFVPFLDYDVEIRRAICGTNVVAPVNARYRRAVRAPRCFPIEHRP